MKKKKRGSPSLRASGLTRQRGKGERKGSRREERKKDRALWLNLQTACIQAGGEEERSNRGKKGGRNKKGLLLILRLNHYSIYHCHLRERKGEGKKGRKSYGKKRKEKESEESFSTECRRESCDAARGRKREGGGGGAMWRKTRRKGR